jgi:hypothetical protein
MTHAAHPKSRLAEGDAGIEADEARRSHESTTTENVGRTRTRREFAMTRRDMSTT